MIKDPDVEIDARGISKFVAGIRALGNRSRDSSRAIDPFVFDANEESALKIETFAAAITADSRIYIRAYVRPLFSNRFEILY